MSRIDRFQQYAAAFEVAFDNDDWSVVEPFFTEDAVYEVVADEPLAELHEGREAVMAHFKQALDSFDRRFDSRELELVEGPEQRDDDVWMRWRATYRIGDAPPLVMEGEEIAHFEGERIARLVDRMPDAAKVTTSFLAEHGAKLG